MNKYKFKIYEWTETGVFAYIAVVPANSKSEAKEKIYETFSRSWGEINIHYIGKTHSKQGLWKVQSVTVYYFTDDLACWKGNEFVKSIE